MTNNQKTTSTRTTNTQAKKEAFLKALVAAYGEGAVITRTQIRAVFTPKGLTEFPHPVVIEKNADYRVGRNQYLVTTSSNPASVLAQTVTNMQKLQAKKDQTMLKQDVRTSPAKLMKEVMGEDTPVENDDEDDINALMKTISN